MTIVTNTWRQLVQRRLWPVALLLLGALVAVPFLLAKSPEPVPAPAAPAHPATADAGSADPIVQPISDDENIPTRRVLGVRHNPFAASVRAKKVTNPSADTNPVSSPSSTDTAATGGNSPSASPAPTTNQVPTTTPTANPAPTTTPKVPTATIPAKSIDVRFSSSEGDDLTRMTVQRLETLPDKAEPLLVYLGVKKDGKTAVFMVDSSLTPTGDGSCKPADVCKTIELKPGETELFEAKGDAGAVTGQYRLDVIKIRAHATKVPASSGDSGSSKTANASSAKAGRRALRARIAESGPLPYVYDARSGTLRPR